jgi:hypothetical protein
LKKELHQTELFQLLWISDEEKRNETCFIGLFSTECIWNQEHLSSRRTYKCPNKKHDPLKPIFIIKKQVMRIRSPTLIDDL